MEERLIELVKEHPVLYNTDDKNYHNMNLKTRLWTDIALRCGFNTGDDAQKTWTKLRDAFRSSLKRIDMHRNSESPYPMKMWKHYEQMSFLKSYMKDRRRRADESDETSYLHNDSWNHEASASEGISDQSLLSNSECNTQFRRKNSPETDPILMLLGQQIPEGRKERLKMRDEWQRDVTQPPDDLKLFFDSMYETTKKLRYDLQKFVKRKLFQIVSEAEDAMEQKTVLSVASTSSLSGHSED